ncbi:MAG TPA: hypothetical protein VJ228_01270 [Candidatus Acidoferrales bacterium]|nr:hypothetical protein [Candidatus Acidoferrales bacterium]
MECVDICTPDSFDVIIRAARLYAQLDAKGRWFEAPRTQYVIYGPPPPMIWQTARATINPRSRA